MVEEQGVVFWPMVTFPDIFLYLTFFPAAELSSKDLSGYELCKAYGNFKDEWLEPLSFHNLSGSNFCLIRRHESVSK